METKELIKKYEEFNNYLQTVNIDELKSCLTAKEMECLHSGLVEVGLRDIPLEINKALHELKMEENSEPQSRYRYPELDAIDFMSEKKKTELDKYLGMLNTGSFVFHLGRYTTEPKILEEYLKEKGIIGEVFHLTCSRHYHLKITAKMTLDEVNRIKNAVIQKDREELDEAVEGIFCPKCEDIPDYREWRDEYIQTAIVLKREYERF